MGTVMFRHLAQQHDQLRRNANPMAGSQSELSQLNQDICASVHASVHAGRLITKKTSTLQLHISGAAASLAFCTPAAKCQHFIMHAARSRVGASTSQTQAERCFPKRAGPTSVEAGNSRYSRYSRYQQAC